MTKRFFLLLIFAVAISSVDLSAQFKKTPNGLTWKVLFPDFYTPLTDLSHFRSENFQSIGGAEIGYYRNINKYFNVGAPLRLMTATLPVSRTKLAPRSELLAGLDVMGQLHLFGNNGRFLVPYLTGGIGALYEDLKGKVTAQVPVGAGLNIRLMDGLYLQGQTEYRYGLADNRNNWVTSGGLLVLFGKMQDRDGDGIADDDDKCPDVKGIAKFQGCPDTDGDGIQDSEDSCPLEYGLIALKGCPDRDEDGIADKDDACPDEKGLAALNGCPDRDGDGIADKDDDCPDVKGTIELRGCPDTDGDGIADKDDACPNEKGTKANKGCPDTDGDGIVDKDDACPTVAGILKFKGCPDTDGDGLMDKDDKCPKEAGPISNQGCPEMKKEDKEVLTFATQAVQFETGKTSLLKKSYPVLDKVYEVLMKYPNYNCSINGFTDNVGNPSYNQKLSEGRAKVCMDYLVKKGVPASRLTSAGYGENQPVGDNKTAAGRAQNRRTEFNVFPK